MAPALKERGVGDPDLEWGDYIFLRPWDERAFLGSLKKAEEQKNLSPDGNRAVLFCSTTAPYQTIRHPIAAQAELLNTIRRELVRKALIAIRDHSTLRVRILTRSPLAKQDFDLFKSFGKRLMFGMSLPTLNNHLSRIYEPHSPPPTQRLKTLQEAEAAGLNLFVAMAATYPESDEVDLRKTMTAIAELNPFTVFHGVVNISTENISRVVINASLTGKRPDVSIFKSYRARMTHAFETFAAVERIAKELKLTRRLHLWPDKSMATQKAFQFVWNPYSHQAWLDRWWNRVSAWPK
jgi:DNA repair photolyase